MEFCLQETGRKLVGPETAAAQSKMKTFTFEVFVHL